MSPEEITTHQISNSDFPKSYSENIFQKQLSLQFIICNYLMDTKLCYRCQIEKSILEFNKCKNTKCGYSSNCKTCINREKKNSSKHRNVIPDILERRNEASAIAKPIFNPLFLTSPPRSISGDNGVWEDSLFMKEEYKKPRVLPPRVKHDEFGGISEKEIETLKDLKGKRELSAE